MVLWVEVEYEDGTEERLPALNRERFEVEDYILSMRVVRDWIYKREQLEERRYQTADIEKVIQNLREGDRVRVSTYPESYSEQTLTMECGGDDAIGINEDGDKYHLLPVYWGERRQGDGQPWMRTEENWQSRGEIEEIEILELSR